MKTDLEVEVEVDLRQLGKVLIFRDKQTALIIYRSSPRQNILVQKVQILGP